MGPTEIILMVVIGLFLLPIYAAFFRSEKRVERSLLKELESQGCSSIKLEFLEERVVDKWTFDIEFDAIKNGEAVQGQATVRARGTMRIKTRIFGETPVIGEVPEGPGLADDIDDLDLETRIRFETNQRVEKLRGDREAFFEFDTNADGIVDTQEVEALRAEIENEVRAELMGAKFERFFHIPPMEGSDKVQGSYEASEDDDDDDVIW